jgi:flagellar assembly protein FliH
MSSRILRAGEQWRAEPVVWRPAVSLHETPGRTPPADTPPSQQDQPEEMAHQLREAREAGFREGQEAVRSQLVQALDRLARSVEALASLRPRLRREAEEDLLELALAIARRILRRELTVDRASVAGLVKAALEKLQAQEVNRVRVHPDHERAVRDLLDQPGRGCAIEVISDPSRELGDVVFESARGSLDASVGTQLEEIERGLADRLGRQA